MWENPFYTVDIIIRNDISLYDVSTLLLAGMLRSHKEYLKQNGLHIYEESELSCPIKVASIYKHEYVAEVGPYDSVPAFRHLFPESKYTVISNIDHLYQSLQSIADERLQGAEEYAIFLDDVKVYDQVNLSVIIRMLNHQKVMSEYKGPMLYYGIGGKIPIRYMEEAKVIFANVSKRDHFLKYHSDEINYKIRYYHSSDRNDIKHIIGL